MPENPCAGRSPIASTGNISQAHICLVLPRGIYPAEAKAFAENSLQRERIDSVGLLFGESGISFLVGQGILNLDCWCRLPAFHWEGDPLACMLYHLCAMDSSDSHLSATPADLMAAIVHGNLTRLHMLIMRHTLLNSSDLTRAAPLDLVLLVLALLVLELQVPERKRKSRPFNKGCTPQR